MTARFSPRVEAALRGLAGLPWEELEGGKLRCCERCPIGAAAEAEGFPPDPVDGFYQEGRFLGWSDDEMLSVAMSADFRGGPLRPRLLALLRGEA